MAQRRELENEEKEKYWQRQVARQASSGLSQSDYCRKEHLNPSRLSWWKRKLASKYLTGKGNELVLDISEPAQFVPVEVKNAGSTGMPASAPVAEIDFSARVVKVYAGASRHDLYEVLAALREVSF